MENLAPAGNREALERAEAAGADAVYLGYSAFSARAGAGNFDREGLAEAIRFAHLRGMRVHVTVNTLVKDGELEEALAVLRLARDLGADAVLVQDLGLLRLARSCCPGLTLHASTQMGIHNRVGVRWCAAKGMRRVVLARECSLAEIRDCCAEAMEIEVFAHGALCVAVSGQCLFSSMVGERSGNRGRCAQPCRRMYTFRGQRGAWLSPRDICLREELPALAEAGVASVKIEGRGKRPEYVGVVAESYARGLKSLDAGHFSPLTPEERQGLLQIYNRGGFMKGYAGGDEDAGVIQPAIVSHQGVEIGRVQELRGNLARVRLSQLLNDGDGLILRHDRGDTEVVYAGPAGHPGDTVTLRLREGHRVQIGQPVFRLTDAAQLEQVRGMPGRRIPVKMALRAMPGEPLGLRVTDGVSEAVAEGNVVEAAQSRPAGAEELIRSLRKTGETVFTPEDIRIETENAFVPVSGLNALRREALDALAEMRMQVNTPDNGGEGAVPPEHLPASALPPLAVVRTLAQGEMARAAGCRVIHDPEDWRRPAMEALLERIPAGDWLQLPTVCEEKTLEAIHAQVTQYREKLGGVLLGSVGQLGLSWPLPIAAGSGVPVMNRQAATLLLEEGCAFAVASPELSGGELHTLLAGDPPLAVPVYGRAQLMILHHCPARTALGFHAGHGDCTLCDTCAAESLQGATLDDDRGYRYPLLRQRLPEGCLVRLMNTVPTDLLDKRLPGGKLLTFTTETPAETRQVLAAFAVGQRSALPATSGHWKRPVL